MNVRAGCRHAWLGALLGLVAPLPAWTQVTVIYDSGQTRPLAPYLEVLGEGAPEPAPPAPPGFQFGAGDFRNLLPIRSPGLTPGKVPARAHSRPLSRPVFLVGSDARSRHWLARHRARLEAIGAVGLLVQARTMDDLRAVSALAAGLPVMPASGSDLARALGLVHYPVLITSRGIEQ